jgi:hypothetical protein
MPRLVSKFNTMIDEILGNESYYLDIGSHLGWAAITFFIKDKCNFSFSSLAYLVLASEGYYRLLL